MDILHNNILAAHKGLELNWRLAERRRHQTSEDAALTAVTSNRGGRAEPMMPGVGTHPLAQTHQKSAKKKTRRKEHAGDSLLDRFRDSFL